MQMMKKLLFTLSTGGLLTLAIYIAPASADWWWDDEDHVDTDDYEFWESEVLDDDSYGVYDDDFDWEADDEFDSWYADIDDDWDDEWDDLDDDFEL